MLKNMLRRMLEDIFFVEDVRRRWKVEVTLFET